MEVLHCYSVLFEESEEWQLLVVEIKNIVAIGGPKRMGEVKVERWGDEL